MLRFNQLCKNMNKRKRNIKEVTCSEIDLNKFLIIDVRSRREFKEGHLENSINIPLPEIRKNIEKQINDKTTKILVCCASGIRSKKAAEILENIGYINVYNLKGGLENI